MNGPPRFCFSLTHAALGLQWLNGRIQRRQVERRRHLKSALSLPEVVSRFNPHGIPFGLLTNLLILLALNLCFRYTPPPDDRGFLAAVPPGEGARNAENRLRRF
jgi:hypothetical protein